MLLTFKLSFDIRRYYGTFWLVKSCIYFLQKLGDFLLSHCKHSSLLWQRIKRFGRLSTAYLSSLPLSTVSIDVKVPFFDVNSVDVFVDENHSAGFDAFGATHDNNVVTTPTPMTAPMDRLKLQLLRTMSGLYLKLEFGLLMMTAMAI